MPVRFATMRDLPALTDLLGFLFEQEEEFRPERQKQELGLSILLSRPDKGVIVVAEHEGQVKGMVSLQGVISTSEGGPALLLEDMIVHPEARSHGLGKALLDEAVAYAKREGFVRISLHTDRMNARAQKLYAKYGFKASTMTLMKLNFEAQ